MFGGHHTLLVDVPLRPGLQRHAPQGNRTCEFVLLVDRPVDYSARSRSRLPLQFGGDQRPFGRMDFASFAMLAMPGHRSGAVLAPRGQSR
jgi:hypothetical protein